MFQALRDRRILPATGSALLLCLAIAAGCAANRALPLPPDAADAPLRRCAALFTGLDDVVDRAGVRDGAAARVKGFPYLRVDRFLASYREEPMSRDAEAWWVARLRSLDLRARAFELGNLPAAHRARLPPGLRSAGDPLGPLDRCARKLSERDLADPSRLARLREAARVPDDYQLWKRVLGLYPVTSLAFYQGVVAYQAETRATFAKPLRALPTRGRLVAYEPPATPARRPGDVAAILERSRGNPLRVPLPEGADLARLLAAHAPVFEVDVADRNDRIVTPVIRRDGGVGIDTTRPAVFVRTAHTRFLGEPLLQLVYSVWFPARPREGLADLLGGHLDGVTWRVTLDREGAPLVYDTMHNCGCYHVFFPGPRLAPRPHAPALEEPALVVGGLGARPPGGRILLRIASRTHYVQDVRYGEAPAATGSATYVFEPDDRLRSVAGPGGIRRSLFGPDGIVDGSERGERYLFWPMGVREPGAMRQWGRHATAFVGRRHFDDPYLIERYFRSSEGGG
jgi:hypothetical protein